MTKRAFKREFIARLHDLELDQVLAEVEDQPAQRLVHPLFSCLCNSDEKVRWNAISLFGPVVARVAEQEMEKARIIMRRCMWMLNDESGGIGWGVPESMAEIMAVHDDLAMEYGHILVAYMREDGFYLELEALQRGLMWGIGRLAQKRPQLLLSRGADYYLLPYLDSSDRTVRALAARALGILKAEKGRERLSPLLDEKEPVRYYEAGRFYTVPVRELANQALDAMSH